MSLSAAAERLRADRAGALNRCPVARLRLTLSEQDRVELDALIMRPKREMPAQIIIDALRETGVTVNFDEGSIQSHRRGISGGQGCQCRV